MVFAEKAHCYKKANNYEKALENYLYAFDELEKDPKHEYYKSTYTLYELGLIFYQYKDYDKALKFTKLVSRAATKFDPNVQNAFLPKVTCNLMGEIYRKKSIYDSAQYWHQQCLALCNKQIPKDSTWIAIATACLGDVHFDAKQYNKAEVQYTAAINLYTPLDCKELVIENNVGVAYCNLALIQLQQNNPTLALNHLTIAKKYLTTCTDPTTWLKYYSSIVAYNKQTKSLNNSFIANLDSLDLYEKITEKELDEKREISIEAEMAYTKKDEENKLNVAAISKTKQLLYGSILALVLLSIIAILYTKRKKLQYILKQEKTEREKEKSNQALELANIQLEDFAKNLHEKNDLIEQFTTELELLKANQIENSNETFNVIEKLKQSVVLTEDDWKNFKQNFDKVYPNFAFDIKEKYPTITTAELRYLMFNKLNLSNKEMAASLGIGLEAVRSLKYRAKQKMGDNMI